MDKNSFYKITAIEMTLCPWRFNIIKQGGLPTL